MKADAAATEEGDEGLKPVEPRRRRKKKIGSSKVMEVVQDDAETGDKDENAVQGFTPEGQEGLGKRAPKKKKMVTVEGYVEVGESWLG